MVIKGGVIAYAQMGDPNASIPTPEPVFMRPMWGGMGRSVSDSCIAFVSGLSVEKVRKISFYHSAQFINAPSITGRGISIWSLQANRASQKL
jgi:urease alpha subunit